MNHQNLYLYFLYTHVTPRVQTSHTLRYIHTAMATARRIYFAASIRAGRGDSHLYHKIVSVLHKYGTVLTEHVGDPTLTELGNNIIMI